MARRPVPDSPAITFPETLEVVSLADLKPHPQNYRVHPDEELVHLEASLRQHGLYKNVIVAEDGTLLAGHGVVEAANRLGWSTIAVKRLPYAPDDPEALKVLVGDNEQAALSQVHDGKMADLVAEMRTWDADELLGTGWDAAKLAAFAERLPSLTLGPDTVLPPEEFPAYDEHIPTEYCCPKCGYEWSGKPQ